MHISKTTIKYVHQVHSSLLLNKVDNNIAVAMYLAISNIHFPISFFIVSLFLCYNPPGRSSPPPGVSSSSEGVSPLLRRL